MVCGYPFQVIRPPFYDTVSALGCDCFLGCLIDGALSAAERFTFRHEHVLGTSCEINVWAEAPAQAKQVADALLGEVDRLQKIFSVYDSQSEFMRWQRGQLAGDQLSTELIQVLASAEVWRKRSGGAFDVRAGELATIWRDAASHQRQPDGEQLGSIVASFRKAPYTVEASRNVVKHDKCSLTLDAIAKGFILDAACERIQRDRFGRGSEASAVSLMIGGDMRLIGNARQPVAIASPFASEENGRPITTVELRDSVGLATSGGYRRYYEIDGVKHSHIFDPRSGRSAGALAAVTVIAPSGMEADAAATAVSVLGPSEGLQFIEQLDGFAALLVLNSGELVRSSRWSAYEPKPHSSRPVYVNVMATAEDKDKTGLFVKFTLGSSTGGRYLRPYVAVWLEDKDGFPVKTSVLWLQTTGPGPRWHRDLTKWFSNDQLRKLVEEKELIGTISGATRGPGEYETRFDGTDNDGKPLKPGKYMLCLEAAREHGTHQFVREAIEWSDKPIDKKELKAGTEFSAISYRFVPGKSNP